MGTYNTLIKRYIGSGNWDTIYPKTTADNIISGTFDVARIPNLGASKITSEVFDVARIPNLSANKITSDVLAAARIPDLDASKITTGLISKNILPSIVLTTVIYRPSATLAQFVSLEYSIAGTGRDALVQEGDVFISGSEHKTYIHNGGTAWTAADFTLLESPLDTVTSVNGKTGVVTVTKGDVSLGNVDNTSDANKPVSTAQQTALNLKANKVTITGATKTKITYNTQGIVTAGADLAPGDIPNLAASKITSDTFGVDRIPMLATAKITGLVTELAQLNSGKQRTIMIVDDVAIIPEPAWAAGDIAFEY